MKLSYQFFTLLLLAIYACGEGPEEETGQIMEYKEEPTDTTDLEQVDEQEEEREFEIDFTEVFAAQIGDYSEQAIMVIKQYPEKNGKIPLEGYYYYIKHQKNIDLNGYKELGKKRYYLTESYKGEETGYMEFESGSRKNSFWKKSKDAEEEQPLATTYIDGGTPGDWTLALNGGSYAFEHEIQMYNGPEEGWTTEDAENTLHVTVVNDQYLVFDIFTIGQNAHLGVANGVAEIQGEKATWTAKDGDEVVCRLFFDLSKENEITVTEEDCDYYHGMNARFDCTFTRKK